MESKGAQKLLEEGLASTLECVQEYGAVDATAAELVNVDYPLENKYYDAAARLVSQVIRDYGPLVFMKLYSYKGALAEAFEAVLGVSLDEIWARARQLEPTDVAICACGENLLGSEADEEVVPSSCPPFGWRVPFAVEAGRREIDITGELGGFEIGSCFGAPQNAPPIAFLDGVNITRNNRRARRGLLADGTCRSRSPIYAGVSRSITETGC
jgi:hypothetical protein